MQRSAARGTSTWLRVCLGVGVLAVLLGLVAMHQLPHGQHPAGAQPVAGGGDHSHDGHEHDAVSDDALSDDALSDDAASGTVDTHLTVSVLPVDQVVVAPGRGGGERHCPDCMSLLHRCLAVLAAAVGLVVAAALWLARSSPALSVTRHRLTAALPGARASPPWAVPTLSSLCLLRV